jgi:paraquat-inducible protein A
MKNTFALSLTALFLSIPSAIFPFLKIYVNDDESSATLLQTAQIMFGDGFGLAGIVILLTALLLPVIYLILLAYTSLACILHKEFPHMWTAVKGIDVFHHFQMTDVFIVGILVSIIKLVDMADISFGVGFYCMIAMTLSLISAGLCYDKRLFWYRMNRHE